MSKRRTTKPGQAKETAVSINIFYVIAALLLPIVAGVLLQSVAGGGFTLQPGNNAPLLAGIGLGSWLLGLNWFGLAELGLRGKRPLFSSIGFATLGWLLLLVTRFVFLSLDPEGMNPNGAGRIFLYLLMFEAFAVQLWTFGLLFRVFTAWRGALPAAFGSGAMFGVTAFVLFREAQIADDLFALLYFVVWGVLYGVIRLRTGSILGSVLIQALQSFTVWVVLAIIDPLPPADAANLALFYLVSAAGYAVIIWRLWPKEAGDYRV